MLLLLFLLYRIRYSGSLETGKVSRAKEGYPSQGRLSESGKVSRVLAHTQFIV